MIPAQMKRTTLFSQALPLALGVIAYFLVVGPRALNPTNIAWLGGGDAATHYLGWLFYQNSPWEFPLGLNPSYGLELASSVLYSDSNPLFAFLFKSFSFILPAPFQYFGIWLLLCFTLQAWFGWKLVGLSTRSTSLRLLATGLFVFAPPMLDRLHQHLILVGHFFILAALYLYFHSGLKRPTLAWCLLAAATALVHAYLLAMVLSIWIVHLGNRVITQKDSARHLLVEFAGLAALVGLVCWQAGYFSVGTGAVSSGYGYYRMNLLSIIDPSGWSYTLEDLPETAGDYEGFNYLGLGIISLIVMSIPNVVAGNGAIFRVAGRHWLLLLLMAALAVFSISNEIAFGNFVLHCPLPDFVLALANVFRSSGRMFWPVFYAITFAAISLAVTILDRRTATVVLGLALFVQVIDTSAGWLPIRKRLMATPNAEWSSPLVGSFWGDAARKYNKIRYIPVRNRPPQWQSIAYYAAQHGLATDAVYLARLGRRSHEIAKRQALQALNGQLEKDSLYIMDDVAFHTALAGANRDTNLYERIDGFNVVAPDWKTCADCRATHE